ncbi:MAG: Plug domain-containing protein [Pyrinomonadaceae bacterium]
MRTQDAQTGEVIDNQQIQSLPQLNRDPLELLRLAGNVQGGGGRATDGSDTRINGGRTQGIEYFVDGVAQSTGRGHGVSQTTPTMEGVQEFKVITNGISAEYGRISGGAVEVVSRAGGNEFHGRVFEYAQNDIFNANSWFGNRVGQKRTDFERNRFGGAIGGPVTLPRFGEGGPGLWSGKNRTFFSSTTKGIDSRRLASRTSLRCRRRLKETETSRILWLMACSL